MWKKFAAFVLTLSLTTGATSTAIAATRFPAANHELSKYWSAWIKKPGTYLHLVGALTLYHWPTSRSSKLAHQLAYEVTSYEVGDNRSFDWRVTYLLLLSSLGESNPFT
jgi:hypothetical protein